MASLWAIHDGEKIDRYDRNSPFKVANTAWDGERIHLFGGRNEVLAFQLVVETDAKGVSGLSVSLPELAQVGGEASIQYAPPGEDPTATAGRPIAVFTEHYMHVETGSHADWAYDPGGPAAPANPTGDKPVQLVPENARTGLGGLPIDVDPSSNQAFWFEIYARRDLPAGKYAGSVRVSAGGSERLVPVELELFDFTLPDEIALRTMVYFEDEQVDLYMGQSMDLVDRFHRLAHRHRVEFVHGYDEGSMTRSMERFDGSGFDLREGYEGPGQGLGNRIAPASFYGPPPEYEHQWSAWQASDDWMTYLKGKLPAALTFLYMPDEPSPDQYGEIWNLASFVHNNPGSGHSLPVFVTSSYTPKLDGAIDIWCVPAAGYDIAQAAAQRAAGHGYWFYNGHRPQTGAILIDTPATDARANAWAAFKHGVDVYFLWHADHWLHNFQKVGDKEQNVWANPITFDNRGQPGKPIQDQGFLDGDGVLVYPGLERLHPEEDRGVAGPISTIQLANLRRGVQDHLYLTMARKLGQDGVVKAALASIVPAVFSDAGATVAFAEHGDDYEAARRALAEAISAGH